MGDVDPFDKYLVQSFIEETRVMAIEGDEFSEVGKESAYPLSSCGNSQNRYTCVVYTVLLDT